MRWSISGFLTWCWKTESWTWFIRPRPCIFTCLTRHLQNWFRLVAASIPEVGGGDSGLRSSVHVRDESAERSGEVLCYYLGCGELWGRRAGWWIMYLRFRRSFQDRLESGEQPRQLRLHQRKSNREYCLILSLSIFLLCFLLHTEASTTCAVLSPAAFYFLPAAGTCWWSVTTLKFNAQEKKNKRTLGALVIDLRALRAEGEQEKKRRLALRAGSFSRFLLNHFAAFTAFKMAAPWCRCWRGWVGEVVREGDGG